MMEVREWPISDVRPYKDNPRKIPKEAVERVAASIREFGFQQPIVVDVDGVVIAGHTRLKAAESLGLEEVPVVVAEGLSPEKAKAYRLADNKTAEASSWDESLLGKELDEISLLDLDFSMEDFGFTDMEELTGADPEPHEDDFDTTPPKETDICPGDMFRLGDHILLCGDATKADLSGAHKARQIACSLVRYGFDRAEVQMSYAIGMRYPLSVLARVVSGGVAEILDMTEEAAEECTPRRMTETLHLLDADFVELARYGHFRRAI